MKMRTIRFVWARYGEEMRREMRQLPNADLSKCATSLWSYVTLLVSAWLLVLADRQWGGKWWDGILLAVAFLLLCATVHVVLYTIKSVIGCGLLALSAGLLVLIGDPIVFYEKGGHFRSEVDRQDKE